MAAAAIWLPNTGHPPRPATEDAPPIDRVFVRLASGIMPAESWLVFPVRGPATRWSLTGHPFDITHWRPA